MITLEVTTDNQSGIAGMLSGLASQLPFAYSVAINLTVNSAQKAIQASLPNEFHLRHASFIEQTIYRKPGQDFATKTNLVGTVRVNPERNFLAKYELGGEKTSSSGKSLAVPIVRLGAPNLIIQRSDPLNVKMLMASINAGHGKVFKVRKSKGGVKVTTDANRVYLAKSAKGTFIIQRTGPGQRDTRVLYAFEKEVPIKDQLHFEDTAMAAALAAWDENWDAALQRAIDTMR